MGLSARSGVSVLFPHHQKRLSHPFPWYSLTFPSCGRLWEDPRNAELGPEKSRARFRPKIAGEGAGQGSVVRTGQDQDVLRWR